MTAEVSHGRGGAGNIAADDTKYVDGEVVRAGPEGSHGTGAFSSGRGGAGNIMNAENEPGLRADKDLVPKEAYRPSIEGQDYHVGRGGAGNAVEMDKPAAQNDTENEERVTGETHAEGRLGSSLANKIKAKVLAPFRKK